MTHHSDAKPTPKKGTGDGLFHKSSPYPKKIREEERGELFGRNTEITVSPVPRPLPVVATFRQHLATGQFSHPFARDFAGDALGDPDMPEPSAWPELAAYLRECGACRPAVLGAMIAWRDYRAQRPG